MDEGRYGTSVSGMDWFIPVGGFNLLELKHESFHSQLVSGQAIIMEVEPYGLNKLQPPTLYPGVLVFYYSAEGDGYD